MLRRRPVVVVVVVALVGCSLPTVGEFASGKPANGGPSVNDGGGDAPGPTDGDTPLGSDATTLPDGAKASRYEAQVLLDKPFVYLRLGETSGSVVRSVADLAGGKTITGTYLPMGVKLGQPGALAGDTDTAITLDGAGGIAMPPGADFEELTHFSVEVWLKPAPGNPAYGFLIDHEDWNQGRRGWLLKGGTQGVGFERRSAVDLNVVGGPPATTAPMVWHYLVVTYDGSLIRIYADGSQIDAEPTTLPLPLVGNAYVIGRQNCICGDGNSFVGSIDELALYDHVLTDQRIAAHLAAAK